MGLLFLINLSLYTIFFNMFLNFLLPVIGGFLFEEWILYFLLNL